MAQHPGFPNFDPVFCTKVIKVAAVACLAVLGVTLAVLVAIDPEPDLCPGWHLRNAGHTSAWLLVVLAVALPTAWACYIAMRPKWLEQKMVASLSRHEFIGEYPSFLFPMNLLMIVVMTMWTCFCGLPLLLILGECTRLFKL